MATNQPFSEAEAKEVLRDNDNAGKIETTSEPEPTTKPDQQIAPRPTPLIWFLVCVGLYLGALLYGKKLSTLSSRVLLIEGRP
jgi:hypothetical protein